MDLPNRFVLPPAALLPHEALTSAPSAPLDVETDEKEKPKHPHEMTPKEIRARIIELGFEGDAARFEEFCERLRNGLPPGTCVAVRGSAVTGVRWEDGAPFDAKGKGTSDLDITLIGDQVMGCWNPDGFYIPALHTKPAGDEYPDMAPALEPLRRELQALAGRPVNFQATNNLVLYVRDILMGQPYFMLIEPEPALSTE